jgi:hypothetical protein
VVEAAKRTFDPRLRRLRPNGEGLIDVRTAERRASEAMLKKQAKGSKRITVGEDKAYDTSDRIGLIAGVLLSHALSGELRR